jgi:hypothetical protein
MAKWQKCYDKNEAEKGIKMVSAALSWVWVNHFQKHM